MAATALKTQQKVWIPELSSQELARRVVQTRPVIRVSSMLYFIQPVHPTEQSFLGNPRTTEMALLLKRVDDILTYHTYNDYGTFTPSVAEVLAAIPDNLTGYVVAFEIIRHLNAPIDLHEHREAVAAGYHVAHTRLYRDA